MAEMRVIKLKLDDIFLDALEGSGDRLSLKVRAFRKTKAGTPELYEMEIAFCRYGVKQLLMKLKEMHVRDRDRIAREQQRIHNEINALKVDP